MEAFGSSGKVDQRGDGYQTYVNIYIYFIYSESLQVIPLKFKFNVNKAKTCLTLSSSHRLLSLPAPLARRFQSSSDSRSHWT